MKKFTISALMLFAGVLSASSAIAEGDALKANVPFAFAVNDKVLPAGHYEIEQISNQQIPNGLLVRNIDQPQYAVVVLGAEGPWEEQPNYVSDQSKLVFDDYDGQHFLREVHAPSASLNQEFPKSKAEVKVERKEVASAQTQTIIVAGQ